MEVRWARWERVGGQWVGGSVEVVVGCVGRGERFVVYEWWWDVVGGSE